MKRFIKNIVSFLGLIIVLLFVIIITINKSILKNKNNFKISPTINKIILGHSHPEGAFNDSIIKNSRNLASSGELYFYTYLKLKTLLEENKGIKQVYLGFTNNQITNDMEKWTKDDVNISHNIGKYSPVMSYNDYKYIAQKNPLGVIKSLGNVFKTSINFLSSKNKKFIDYKGWGGYNYMTKNHVDSLIQAQNKGLVYVQDVSKANYINLYYLDKIVALCQALKIKLFLVRTPFHNKYLGFKNEKLFQDVLKNRYASVAFLDFRLFPLSNKEYRDLDHINYLGAKKFSIFFNKLIKDSIFYKENPEIVVKRKIMEYKENK